MTSHEEQSSREAVPLAIMWRNPQAFVQAQLRRREASHVYSGWAEQARKIRARRANWDANHRWAAPRGCLWAWDPRPHCGSALDRGQDSRRVGCWVSEPNQGFNDTTQVVGDLQYQG